MKISSLDKAQWVSVLKAALYAFFSGAVGTLVLMSADFIKAAQDGKTAILNLAIALIVGAVVGGINGIFVFGKKLFTPTS